MNKKIAILFLLGSFIGNSQSLPSEMYYSTDGRILYTGNPVQTGLYDKNTIKDVFLNFAQTNYWTLLTNNYASETNIEATMIYDGVTYPGVGVRFRGNTSYSQIGTSQKKSFGVDMDFIDPTQKLLGYTSLKFNNAHQDASFMREVLYDRMARRHNPIAKANFIHLYINNQDWGLYPNVQGLDKAYLEDWFVSNDGAFFRANPPTAGPGGGSPNWGDGTAGMNYLGTNQATYQSYYTLKSNDIVIDPWQKLVDATQTLSTAASGNVEAVKAKIDVDKVLWHLACENIFTDDDSYVMKGKMDYMAYYEPETGRMTSLEYDGNSTFVTSAATSTNWGPFKNASNVNYPLLNKLLNIAEWRQRYLAHYRTILTETFTTANANALIDEMHNQISALVAADPKKLYTTTQYNTEYNALKTFVNNRRNYLLSNTEVAQVAPVITSAKFYNINLQEYVEPVADEVANIKAVVTATTGINTVNLYYASGVVGNFTKIQMFDDGLHNDDAAGDGTYGAQIPGQTAGTLMRYYVEAIANNTARSASYLPAGAEHDIFVYRVGQVVGANGVVINEIMAQNNTTIADEVGDFEDWIELYNNNDFEVDLSGYYLTDTAASLVKWQIPPGTVIPANDYLIIWADNEATDGPMHASFKLAAEGESVLLSNPNLLLVDQVTYEAQTVDMGFARVPNGTGSFVIQAPTFDNNNDGAMAVTDFDRSNSTLIVYPNPATSFINLKFSDDLMGEKVKIYNSLGQLLYDAKAAPNMGINMGAYVSGLYFIKCGNITKKLVIE